MIRPKLANNDVTQLFAEGAIRRTLKNAPQLQIVAATRQKSNTIERGSPLVVGHLVQGTADELGEHSWLAVPKSR